MDQIVNQKLLVNEFNKCVSQCNTHLKKVQEFSTEVFIYFMSIMEIMEEMKSKSDKKILKKSKKDIAKLTTKFFKKLIKVIQQATPNTEIYKGCLIDKCGDFPNIKDFIIGYNIIITILKNKAFQEAIKTYKDVIVRDELVDMFEELYIEL